MIRKWWYRIRRRLCRWLCPDMTWNEDMSREIDRQRIRIEELEGRK